MCFTSVRNGCHCKNTDQESHNSSTSWPEIQTKLMFIIDIEIELKK